MELTEIALLVSCFAGLVSVVSFFKSGRKEQTELDQLQNEKIGKIEQRASLLEQGQSDIKERITKAEAKIEVLPSEISKSMSAMEDKIENRISNMERNLTELIKAAMR